MADRLLPNWLEAYLRLVEETEPPRLFHKWVGVSTIASALMRKCYLQWDARIYPNFYVAIIGPSGSRKGTAMSFGMDLLRDLGIRLAAEAITREALIVELMASVQSFPDPETDMPITHSSLTILSPELAVFLGYDNKQLISDLTDWYDCRGIWTYRTKNSGEFPIEGVWVNLIGATTPELLQKLLPREAIGGGLTSRMIFVYGDRKYKIVPYPVLAEGALELRTSLITDLQAINTLQGRFTTTPEFIDTYIDWYIDHCNTPVIDDENFKPYLERRPTHLRKLAMIMSASRGMDMIIDKQDFESALVLLEETEGVMPRVFQGYGRAPLAELYPRLMAFIARQRKATYSEIVSRFYRDATKEELGEMIVTMEKIGFLTVTREKKGDGTEVIVQYAKK